MRSVLRASLSCAGSLLLLAACGAAGDDGVEQADDALGTDGPLAFAVDVQEHGTVVSSGVHIDKDETTAEKNAVTVYSVPLSRFTPGQKLRVHGAVAFSRCDTPDLQPGGNSSPGEGKSALDAPCEKLKKPYAYDPVIQGRVVIVDRKGNVTPLENTAGKISREANSPDPSGPHGKGASVDNAHWTGFPITVEYHRADIVFEADVASMPADAVRIDLQVAAWSESNKRNDGTNPVDEMVELDGDCTRTSRGPNDYRNCTPIPESATHGAADLRIDTRAQLSVVGVTSSQVASAQASFSPAQRSMFIDTTGDDHAHKYTTVLFSAPVSDLAAGDVVEALVRVGLHNDPNNLRNDGKTKYVFNHLTNVSLILTGSPDDVEPTDPGGNNGATPRYARWMSGDRGMNCPPIGCTRVMGGAIRSDEVPAGKPMYVNAVAIAVEAGNGTSDVKNARLDVTARNGDDNTLVVTCHSTHARGGNPCRPGL